DNFPADVASEQWLKFGCYAERPEVLAAVWRQLQALGPYELTQSNSANLEINPPGVSKASGLAVACRALGLAASQVVAIGDGRNDVPMLRWAGCGIAMGNASKPVQAAATWVTATCAEDGVACAIERLLAAGPGELGPCL
ncbi:MAG: HAD hydrolase family protein, partial [Alicyclobacillus sp.]|nr:HAD hydrolase family protein [Alicyclobacillus sp.]